MKWQTVIVALLLFGLAYAQVPAAPLGSVAVAGTKAGSKKRDRVLDRVKIMRQRITAGQPIKSHVKVRVRLQNSYRLTGVVKDGRLVERVEGLRFVDATASDPGAGVRLWYSGGTRSYVFIPFDSLESYEVVQRLSHKQLLKMEKELQMAEQRANKSIAMKAQRTLPPLPSVALGGGGAKPEELSIGDSSVSSKQPVVPSMPKLPIAPLASVVTGPGTVGGSDRATPEEALPVKAATGEQVALEQGASDLVTEDEKKELYWSELLQKYPPKQGWSEPKKNEISRRQVVIGARPSDIELAFVKEFDQWIQACEHARVDPNASLVKKPATKRPQHRRSR